MMHGGPGAGLGGRPRARWRRLTLALMLVVAVEMGEASARACEVSLVVLVDVSQSARLAVSRLRDALGRTLGSLFEGLPATARVGLMTFGTNATWRVAMGPVRERSAPIVSEVGALRFDEAWTDLLTPLLAVSDAIAPAKSNGAVLLISDGVISLPLGRASEAKDDSVLRGVVAPAFAARGARIHGLAIQSPGEDLIFDLAKRTGGVGVRLDVDADLAALGRDLAARMCPTIARSPTAKASTERDAERRDEPGAGRGQGAATPARASGSVTSSAGAPKGDAASGAAATGPATSAPSSVSASLPRSPHVPAGSTAGGSVIDGGAGTARWSLAGGVATVFGAGLAGALLAAFVVRRRARPALAGAEVFEVDPNAFVLVAPELDDRAVAPRVFDDARVAATELHADATCEDHRSPTTWHCTSCGRACCGACPKSADAPPRCVRCVKAAAPPPKDNASNLVFVVVWNEARAKVLKKCELWREGEAVDVFGRDAALAPLDAPPSMGGRLRLEGGRDGRRVVVIEEVPPGGFYCVEDGRVLRPGDRLQNNQRFQWHKDGRVFEVVYK